MDFTLTDGLTLEVIQSIVVMLTTAVVSIVVFFRSRKFKEMSETIGHQLNNNGGTSLLDKIDKLHQKIDDMSTSVSRLEVWKTAWMQLHDHPIFIANTKGHCMWVNGAYTKITGASFSELEGYGWLRVMHQEDKDRVAKEWELAVSTGTMFLSEYKVLNLQTKSTLTVRCRAKPLTGQDGVPVGYIGIWDQIS